jgi:uroporphyrinogen decarboxylase
MNMMKWLDDQLNSKTKKAIPLLSFPAVQLLDVSVKELISSSELQARAMQLVAQRCDSGASVSMMDLSVEAQSFGAEIKFSDDEVPTVTGKLIQSLQDAEDLKVPEVGSGRTGIYLEAIKKASALITDRPILAGVIGPFSLAGRLMDISEALVNCYAEPEMMHIALQKSTDFLIEYIKSYKQAGAHGVVIAEPAGGLLSPNLVGEFSSDYVRRIVDAVQSDDFIIIYHNCGNVIPLMESILTTNSAAYHFGNSIDMAEALKLVPDNIITMGNVDPVSQFRQGTPETIAADTLRVQNACSKYDNFVISSGCDIPPLADWDNIDTFFKTVKEFYF